MTIRVVDQGEEALLDLILAVNYTIHLFTNDVTSGLTPSEVDALDETDFTEATFTGYASAALTGGSWTVTASNPTIASYAQQSFTRSSTGTPEDIYGYYVTDTTTGALRWFEQFDAPVVMEFASDELAITPRITLDDTEGNDVQPGTITAFGGDTAPTGWLLCDGSAVSRTTYADLFAAIGTNYGTGDGSTTFNLPDLQQRFPLGKATSGTGAALGDTGGAIDHTHGLDTSSSHAKVDVSAAGNQPKYKTKTVSSWNSDLQLAGTGSAHVSARTGGVSLGGDSDTENPPYAVVNFIIRAA